MAEMTTITDKSAEVLFQRVDRALRFAEREYHKLCKRARDLYHGQHWPGMRTLRSERSRIVVNYMRPAVETKVSNLAFAYPAFHLKPLNRTGTSEHSKDELSQLNLR